MNTQMRTIEVDWQVRQMIEAERRAYDDPPNAALRRLLGIDPAERPLDVSAISEAHYIGTGSASWNWKGVTLPEGTELRVEYSEVRAGGHVARGLLTFDGEGYKAPSQAVMAVVARRRGNSAAPTSINGWQYLHALLPGESRFEPLAQVREKSKLRCK